MTEITIDKLEFVRLRIPSLIPLDLIEAVKGRNFTPEAFIKSQEEQIDNPHNFLFALIDTDSKIQGYLWVVKEPLDDSLYINTFSIKKEYWGKGKGIELATEFLDGLVKKMKPSKVLWATTNERFFLKKGFKKSKISLMEYNPN